MYPEVRSLGQIGVCLNDDLITLGYNIMSAGCSCPEHLMGLTYPENQDVGLKWLYWNQVVLYNCKVVAVDPDLVRQQAPCIDQTQLISLALLHRDLMPFTLSGASRVLCGVAVEDALAVQERAYRQWCVRCEELFMEHTECVIMVPVSEE
jgi:hypothetical protein